MEASSNTVLSSGENWSSDEETLLSNTKNDVSNVMNMVDNSGHYTDQYRDINNDWAC